MPKAKFHIERKCNICGTTFIAKTLESVHCSRKCSNAAYRKKKRVEKEQNRLRAVLDRISEKREYVTIEEASAMFGIHPNTLYRLVRTGRLSSINLGKRLIRLNKSELNKKYSVSASRDIKNSENNKKYILEPEFCYFIGEITQKYNISESTIYYLIRKNSIPTRQIGKFVYVPRDEIDRLLGN